MKRIICISISVFGLISLGHADSNLSTNNVGYLAIHNNNANSQAGGVLGLKITTQSDLSENNPQPGDNVAIYAAITSSPQRRRIWAFNPIVGVPGTDATAWISEFDLNNMIANAPDPYIPLHKLGVDVVSGGAYAPSAAYGTNSTSMKNRWKHGIWFTHVGGQVGSTLIKASDTVNVDYGLDVASASISKQAVRAGATPAGVVATIASRQLSNGVSALFLQRNTDTAPAGSFIYAVNAANSKPIFNVDVNGNVSGSAIHATVITATAGVQLPVVKVAQLPTCSVAQKGLLYAVSDALGPSYNGLVKGGGLDSVPVYCNGNKWTAH